MRIFASAGPNQLRPFLETPVGIKLINSFLFLFSSLFVMLLFFPCYARVCYIITATDRDIKIFDNWSVPSGHMSVDNLHTLDMETN